MATCNHVNQKEFIDRVRELNNSREANGLSTIPESVAIAKMNSIIEIKQMENIPSLEEITEYLQETNYDRLASGVFEKIEALKDQVYREIPDPIERQRRADIIAEVFSRIVDAEQDQNPMLSREDIIKTLTPKGILNSIRDLLSARSKQTNKFTPQQIAKLEVMLNNLPALIKLAAPKITLLEGLKFDITYSKAEKANINETNSGEETSIADELGDATVKEEEVLEGWQFKIVNISSKNSLSREVRKLLSHLKETDINGNPVVDDLGFVRNIDSDYAHATLIDQLRFMDNATQLVPLLKSLAQYKPWVNQVIKLVEKDETLKSKFYQDFRKDFIQFWVQRATLLQDGTYAYKTIPINSPQGIGFLLREWRDNYQSGRTLTENSIYDKVGFLDNKNVKHNGEVANALKDKFNKLSWANGKEEANILHNNKLTLDFLEENKDAIADLFKSIGISTPIDTIYLALTSNQVDLENKVKALDGNFKTMINSFSLIFEGLQKEDNKVETDEFGEDKRIEFEVIFKGPYTTLANMIRPMINDAIESSVYENGKSYYSHLVPSYLGKLIKKLKNSGDIRTDEQMQKFFQEEFKSTFWFFNDGKYRSEWLRLLADPGVKGKEARNMLDHKVLLHFDKVDYSQLSSTDYSVALLNEFFIDSDKEDFAYYHIPVLADAPSGEFIKFKRYGDKKKHTHPITGAPVTYDEVLIHYMGEVVEQEYDRIKIIRARKKAIAEGKDVTPIQNLDKSGDKFHFFPALNEVLETLDNLYAANDIAGAKALIENTLRSSVNKGFENFIEELYGNGALDVIEDNKLKYVKIKAGSTFKREVNELGEIQYSGTVVNKLRNYFLNSMYATSQIIQLTQTDLAQFKNVEDFYKRNKEIHAPSLRLNTEATWEGVRVGKEIQKSIQIKDSYQTSSVAMLASLKTMLENKVKNGQISKSDLHSILAKYGAINSWSYAVVDNKGKKGRFIKNVDASGKVISYELYNVKSREFLPSTEEAFLANQTTYNTKAQPYYAYKDEQNRWIGNYTKEHNQTDGQAYRSLPSYRATMIMAGQWDTIKERAFTNIKKGAWGMQDFNTMFQPRKPYLFGQRYVDSTIPLEGSDGNAVLRVGTQHKDSELVLLPLGAYAASPQLMGLSEYMEENDIDLIVFESATKVGGQATLDINNLTDKNAIKNFLKNKTFTNGVINTQYVSETKYEDYGIQQEVPEHAIDAVSLFGTQIRKLIYADMAEDMKITIGDKTLTKSEWIKHYKGLITENIIQSFEQLDTIFQDKQKLSDILVEEVRGNPRYGPDMQKAVELDGDGNFNIPLFEPSQSARVQSLLNSIIKSRITKQKINGGSIVQASNFGLMDELEIHYKKDGSIDYIDAYMPIYTEKFADQLTDLDGNIDINKLDKDGNFIFPEELRRLIAYRIPTEDKYSMLPIRIKGFLPQTSGSVIMLPAEITTITGSDFDIDKMYLMIPEFRVMGNTITKVKYEETANRSAYNEYVRANTTKSDQELVKERKEENKIQVRKRVQELKDQVKEELDTKYHETFDRFINTFSSEEYAQSIKDLNESRATILMDLTQANRDMFSNLKSNLDKDNIRGINRTTQYLLLTTQLIEKASQDVEALKALAAIHEAELNIYGASKREIDKMKESFKEYSKSSYAELSNRQRTIFEESFNRMSELQAELAGLLNYEAFASEFASNPEKFNSEAARNNRLIDLMTSVLTHKDMSHKIMKPGGFDNTKKISRIMVIAENYTEALGNEAVLNGYGKRPIDIFNYLNDQSLDDLESLFQRFKTPLDALTPTAQIKVHQQNGVAAQLIGIAANHNANHALMQLTKLKLNDKAKFTLNGKSFVLLNKIFTGEVDGKATGKGHYITGNNSEILAASVDAIKDPVLNYLNIDTFTADTYFLMSRLGYDPMEISLFLTQPIIKELAAYYKKGTKIGMTKETAIKDLIDKLNKETLKDQFKERNKFLVADLMASKLLYNTVSKMTENQKLTSEDASIRYYNNFQLQVLEMFQKVSESAELLANEVAATRSDTGNGGAGPTISSTIVKMQKLRDYNKAITPTEIHTPLFDNGQIIAEWNPPRDVNGKLDMDSFRQNLKDFNLESVGDLQAFYTFGLAGSQDLMSKYFPHFNENFWEVLDLLKSYTKTNRLSEKNIDKIYNDLMAYIVSSSNYFNEYNPESKENHMVNTFPTTFEDIKNRYADELKDNQFINGLVVAPPNKDIPYNRVVFREVGGLSAARREIIMNDWSSLLFSENRELQTLALDLFKYSTYRNGFAFGPETFVHLAPIDVKLSSPDYIEQLNKIIKDNSTNYSNYFAEQFILNHPEINSLVPTLSDSSLHYVRDNNNVATILDTVPVNFTLANELSKTERQYIQTLGRRNKNGQLEEPHTLMQFVKVQERNKEVIYKLGQEENQNGETILVYRKIDRLGYYNNYIQYEYGKTIKDMSDWLIKTEIKKSSKEQMLEAQAKASFEGVQEVDTTSMPQREEAAWDVLEDPFLGLNAKEYNQRSEAVRVQQEFGAAQALEIQYGKGAAMTEQDLNPFGFDPDSPNTVRDANDNEVCKNF